MNGVSLTGPKGIHIRGNTIESMKSAKRNAHKRGQTYHAFSGRVVLSEDLADERGSPRRSGSAVNTTLAFKAGEKADECFAFGCAFDAAPSEQVAKKLQVPHVEARSDRVPRIFERRRWLYDIKQ